MVRARTGKKDSIADSADKYVLYEESVQGVEADEEFILKTFKKIFKRSPQAIKEDFSGTALLASEWVKGGRGRTAVAVDYDAGVVEWARVNRLAKLTAAQRAALTLLQQDVRLVNEPKVDVVAALNFSYCIFKQRAQLLDYFRNCYSSLREEGLLILDIYGGSEATEVKEEQREYDDFTYCWDQSSYNPITGELLSKIHFYFPDGSQIEDAFVYDWRLWSVPELIDLLVEAGFKARFYMRDSDDDGGLTGKTFELSEMEDDLTWLAFVVGVKG